MGEVKRWAGGECGGCIESPDGEHVKYEDYARLAEENKKLQVQLEAPKWNNRRFRRLKKAISKTLKAAGVKDEN